jgi:hypothetical protein
MAGQLLWSTRHIQDGSTSVAGKTLGVQGKNQPSSIAQLHCFVIQSVNTLTNYVWPMWAEHGREENHCLQSNLNLKFVWSDSYVLPPPTKAASNGQQVNFFVHHWLIQHRVLSVPFSGFEVVHSGIHLVWMLYLEVWPSAMLHNASIESIQPGKISTWKFFSWTCRWWKHAINTNLATKLWNHYTWHHVHCYDLIKDVWTIKCFCTFAFVIVVHNNVSTM